MKKLGVILIFCGVLTMGLTGSARGEDKIIKLPEPVKTGGMSLREALNNRQSNREFAAGKEFTEQQLSDLLWAAIGVNRPDEGKLTAPSANNSQDISLYVALPNGAYRYNNQDNTLELVNPADIRKDTGMQPFVGVDTIEVVFVCDKTKLKADEVTQGKYAHIDSGYISQNIYLFAAAEKLNTVVRAFVDRAQLSKMLNLRPTDEIIVVQTVGFQG